MLQAGSPCAAVLRRRHDAALALDEFAVSLPMAELYEDVDLSEA